MPENLREKTPEGERQVPLNNFRFYLPGGAYREFPADAQICSAVDTLLQTEFSELDIQQISERLGKLQRQSFNLASGYLSVIKCSPEEVTALDQQLTKVNSTFMKECDKLRPLFERLVEMGFDIADLTR